MNVNRDYSKVSYECFVNNAILNETNKIINFIVDDFAIPYISGLSLETLSQAGYAMRGGKGKKPAPLSKEIKLKIYEKIHQVFVTHLFNTISLSIKSELEKKVFIGEMINCADLFHEPNFEFMNIISHFKTYIKQNYPYECDYLISAVQYESQKFIPDIYHLAQLNEVFKNT